MRSAAVVPMALLLAGCGDLVYSVSVFGDAVPCRPTDRSVVSAALAIFSDRDHATRDGLGVSCPRVFSDGGSLPVRPQIGGRSLAGGDRGYVLRLGRIFRSARFAISDVRNSGAVPVALVVRALRT